MTVSVTLQVVIDNRKLFLKLQYERRSLHHVSLVTHYDSNSLETAIAMPQSPQ